MKRTMLVALLVVPILLVTMPPRAHADEKIWSLSSNTRAADCAYCHGEKGEGGFGPDLAGRAITLDQFKRALRKPWGVMPAYPNLSDQTIADLYGYLESLPKVAEPAAWRVPDPGNNVPKGQRATVVYGCAMCHGLEMVRPRLTLGGMGPDATFEAFKKIVYQHADLYPRNMMGVFSQDHVQEANLKDIFDFVQTIGFRVPITAVVTPGTSTDSNTVYTLTVTNSGRAGKGLTAEDVTIALDVPRGAKVVSTTGTGYEGVRRIAEMNADVAVWKVPRLEANARQTYTLTLSGAGTANAAFKDSMVSWLKPEFHNFSNQLKDPSTEKQIPVAKGDGTPVVVRRAAATQ